MHRPVPAPRERAIDADYSYLGGVTYLIRWHFPSGYYNLQPAIGARFRDLRCAMNGPAVQFGSVLEALGAVDTNPLDAREYWQFFRVKYPTPAGPRQASYLNLAHDCPVNEASSHNIARWKALAAGSYTVVVTKKSRHAQDLARTAVNFRAHSATTARELLFENVVSAFMPRAEQIEEGEYFIQPDITLPNGETNPAVTYLVGSLLGQFETQGKVCADVLVAAAGLGKTTLARAIAAKILDSKRKAIPILVESAQWQNLINLTLPNILNAALLQLIPEAVRLTNSKLFQLLVREQLLVPIFDGFDELCLHPHANYNPTTLITELLELVGDTGARVLITTRETFWETYGASISTDKINRVDLQGFSNDQRKRFFTKRLKRSDERDIANRLAREVGERLYEADIKRRSLQGDRASGVPLLLELIALYVDGNPTATFAPATKDPIGPLLEAICERENVRQQLNISAVRQMNIFEELFRDYSDDVSRADLALYVEDLVPEVTKDVLARFESHAFFSPGRDVKARFESLQVYFVARWLANRLEEAIAESGSEKRIAEVLEENATGNTDVFDFLLDRFAAIEPSKVRAAISHAFRMVQVRTNWQGPTSALFHLSQRLAIKAENTKSERTSLILELLGVSSPIKKLAVQGQVSGIDLSNIVFIECAFRDLEFHNCNFNTDTQFQNSRFDGELAFENCKNGGQVRLTGCKLSESAEDEWDRQAGKAVGKIIDEAVVRDALREILRKFLGPFGFSTIKDVLRNTGPILNNPCREPAWDELFREGMLDRHHISGVSGGGINIANSPEVKHEVRNFLDNAALGPRLQRIVATILKRA